MPICVWSCTDSLLCVQCLLVSACRIRAYFEPLVKKQNKNSNKKGENRKQCAHVARPAVPMHTPFLGHASPLLIRPESAWCDKSSTHGASAWLRLSLGEEGACDAGRYVTRGSGGLALFWNLCLVLMFHSDMWERCHEWMTVGALKWEHLPT